MGKTALLIIDMQNDFCLPGAPFEIKGAASRPQISKRLSIPAIAAYLYVQITATTGQMAAM